jgi:hypothetical protein
MNAIHAMIAAAASAIVQRPPEWQGLYSSSSSFLRGCSTPLSQIKWDSKGRNRDQCLWKRS